FRTEATLNSRTMSRRRFLLASGSALTLTACGAKDDQARRTSPPGTKVPVRSDDPVVTELEQRRAAISGRTVSTDLRAAPMTLDLAGRRVDTWGYGDALPGRLIRATAGDVLEVRL